MRCMFFAELAVFAQLHTVFGVSLVFRGGVVPVFTLSAFKGDNIPDDTFFLCHVSSTLSCDRSLDDFSDDSGSYCPSAFSDSKTQSLLQSYGMNHFNGHGHVIPGHTHPGLTKN